VIQFLIRGYNPGEREDSPSPHVKLTDNVGTTYREIAGGGHGDEFNFRRVGEFVPAIPPDAERLEIQTAVSRVTIEL
jgi:hypothetical protein